MHDGTEITETQEFNPWLGGGIGAVLGYWFAKYNGNNNGCGGNGSNASCSENCYVNRFELAQEGKIAALEMQLAEQKAERYADSVAAATLDKSLNYINAALGSRDAQIAKIAETQYNMASTVGAIGAEVKAANKSIIELAADTTAALKNQWSRTKAEFVHQPHLNVCCKQVAWDCCGGGSDDK